MEQDSITCITIQDGEIIECPYCHYVQGDMMGTRHRPDCPEFKDEKDEEDEKEVWDEWG